MRRTLIAIVALLAASCSGSSTAPSSSTPSPAPPAIVVTPAPNVPVPAPVVRDPARFDQVFWTAFVHNGFEQPNALEPLERLTAAPNIYLRTIDDAGHAIDAVTLNATATALRDVATAWGGGQFGIAGVTQGTDTKVGVHGWVTVIWNAQATSTYCGLSDVGRDGGTIQLSPRTPGCGCPPSISSVAIRPRTVKHELGHAFGYWHTGNAQDLMSGLAVSECDREPSAREVYHATIAYQTPIGTSTARPRSSARAVIVD